jgi:hypothetical protein
VSEETTLSSPATGAPHLLRPWSMSSRAWLVTVLGCVVAAAVSVVTLPRTVAYDPYSWLNWGREIAHLDLNTRHAATSVKPLAIAIDTVIAPAGSHAPDLWLAIARAATLIALALAFRLGCRLGGTAAGIVAVGALAISDEYLGYLWVQGMSEPMCAATLLAAIDAQVRGRRRAVMWWLVASALLRPEAWPLLILYVLWLTYRGPLRRTALALLGAVAVPVSWFVIDVFGAHQFFRSANAATHQSQGGPLLSRNPGLATFRETWHLASGAVVVLFLLATVKAIVISRRSRRVTPTLALAAVAWTWLVVDAVLAQGRFATGAPRYLLPGLAVAAVTVGLFVVDGARLLSRVGPRPAVTGALGALAGVALVVAPRAALVSHQVHHGLQTARDAQHLADALPGAIDAAGGRDAVRRCGLVTTQRFEVPLVAWTLDVPVGNVGIVPAAPGTVFAVGGRPPIAPAVAPAYRAVGSSGPPTARWTAYSTCQ